MSKILCATRGGKPSFRTQDAAITLAKERGDTLLFFYVVDTHFLDKTAAPIVVDAEGALFKMGEFLLLMAKERAAEQGITAETIIRREKFRKAVEEIACSEDVSLIVFGQPAGKDSVFKMSSLQKFVDEIECTTGIETIIV